MDGSLDSGATLRRPELELLAPAGNFTCLTAALKAGADAVYFGADNFNMRSQSAFSDTDLPDITSQAHAAGAKAYLTVNTIVYEDERSVLDQLLPRAAEAGVDAIIAWDPAVLLAARQHGLPVMLSTQASVANTAALRFYHDSLGVNRAVLARECTLEQIRQIRTELDEAGLEHLELETFAHGAMCVAISGRCFMSYHQYGKSANRGECLQPCRREYSVSSKDGDLAFDLGRDYVMSPKDLCTLPFIEQLIEAGVHSYKIEGRNRNPEYVSLVTAAYRRVLDHCMSRPDAPDEAWEAQLDAIKTEEMERLHSVYHRGFSEGFYHGQPLNAWSESAGSSASRKKFHIGRVLNYYSKSGVAHVRVENQGLKAGAEVMVLGPTTGVVAFSCPEMRLEERVLTEAQPGEEITLPVPDKVRRNDTVYIRVER
ncbi:U32 family peptidase [Ruficoccus sp. ZRK36]|uniref:U32 family peptidase n=1 Tax=Ruficoccus sp. ZRK36 TaxID=2866311 RepID=UPI001C7394EF|nr:U32 family peptidase [Ruficoccus sp. ZRK36]QYY36130.1 U32 family peptidase [Ruficoccus sp. ZRK36]